MTLPTIAPRYTPGRDLLFYVVVEDAASVPRVLTGDGAECAFYVAGTTTRIYSPLAWVSSGADGEIAVSMSGFDTLTLNGRLEATLTVLKSDGGREPIARVVLQGTDTVSATSEITGGGIVIPDAATRYVVRPGLSSSVISSTQVYGSSVMRAPSFTVASGQLTRINGNLADIAFATKDLFRILPYAPGTPTADPRDFAVTPSGTPLSAPTVNTIDANTKEIVWATANIANVTIRVAQNATTGRITLTWPTLEIIGASAAIFKLWGFDFPYLRIEPFRKHARYAMSYVTTQFGGKVEHAAVGHTYNVNVDFETPWIAPNFFADPQPYPVNTFVTPPATSSIPANAFPNAMPWVYIYDRETEVGIMLRVHDQNNAEHTFHRKADGTAMEVWCRHYPPDHLGVTSWNSSGVSVSLSPMVGSPYKAADNYATERIADSAGLRDRNKLWAAPTTYVPLHVKQTKAFMSFAIPPVGDANRTAAMAHCITECNRATAAWGKIALQLWSVGDKPHTTERPDNTMPADTIAFIEDLSEIGVETYLYDIPCYVSDDSDWAASNPTYTDYVALNQTTDAYTQSLDGLGGNLHKILNPVHTQSRAWALEQMELLFSQLNDPEHASGVYIDAFGKGLRLPDYRSTLTSAQKGPGSTAMSPAMRTFCFEILSVLRADNPNVSLYTEYPEDYLIEYINWFSQWALQLSLNYGLQTFIPLFSHAFSEWVRNANFQSIVAATSPVTSVLLDEAIEQARWLISRHMLNATLPVFTVNNSANVLPWFAQPGDALYDDWLIAHKPIVDYYTALLAADSSVVAGTGAFIMRGKALEPPPGSWNAHSLRRSIFQDVGDYTVDVQSDLVGVLPGPRCDSAVLISDEWPGVVKVVIDNFRSTDEQHTIQLDPARYAPHLSGRRWLTKNTLGVRTLITTSDWGINTTVTVPAASRVTYDILPEAP